MTKYTGLMYSFCKFEPVHCSCLFLTVASWPAYRFLRRQVMWSGIPISWRIFHSLLWFTQRLWHSQWSRSRFFSGILLLFFDDPMDVGNLISGSSAFSKSSLNIWKFLVHVLLKPAWKILNITLLACEMSATVQYFEHSLTLPFAGDGMKHQHCRVV